MPTLALVGEQWQACGKESYTRLQTGKGFHIPLSADLPHPSLQRSLLFILKANLTQQSSVEHLGTRHTLVSFLFCLSCFGFAKLLESANLYLSSTLGNVWQLFLYMFFFFFSCLHSLSLLFLGLQLNVSDHLYRPTVPVHFISNHFTFCSSKWILSIDLFSNSLTLSSVTFNLLFSP